jgi:hypothetical protein
LSTPFGRAVDDDAEEDLRELYILQLTSYAMNVLDEIPLLDQVCYNVSDHFSSFVILRWVQEIGLLEHMADLRELEQLTGKPAGSDSSVLEGLPSRVLEPAPTSGLEVTRTARVGDQLVMR